MSLTESLSKSDDENTFIGIFNEHYSLSHAKHVFSRMRDRDPKAYEEKKLSIRQAAEILNVDHKTIHQRIRTGLLKVKNEKAENKYVKRMLVSVRDLADMLIEKPFKDCFGKPARRYTIDEINELKKTGKVSTRSYDSYKVKAHRLGLKLRELRAHVVCAECAPENTSEARLTAYNSAMPGGVPPQICEAQTSA